MTELEILQAIDLKLEVLQAIDLKLEVLQAIDLKLQVALALALVCILVMLASYVYKFFDSIFR